MTNYSNFSILCPVLKKEDSSPCANCRRIVWTTEATCQNTDWTLSTIDQIHYAKSWKRSLNNKSTHNLFVDYKAASYSSIRQRVFAAMAELCIFAKLIRLYRMTLSNSSSSVDVGMELYEPFDTVRGFMRPLQLRHGVRSAKGGSTSQWHYFSKKMSSCLRTLTILNVSYCDETGSK